MADGTQPAANGIANAGAPVAQPAPEQQQQQAPAAPAEQQAPPDPFAETRAAMLDGNSENFLADFLAGEGLPVDAAPHIGAPTTPTAPAPPAPPVGNAAPTAPSTGPQPVAPQVPVPAQPVDPALVARLFQPTAQPYPGQPPVGAWPQAPQPTMAPQGQQQQPQAPQQQQPETLPLPFTQAFNIPQEVAEALDHQDPRARVAAIGAIISAAGNQTFQKVVEYVQQNIAPRVANATFEQVQRRDFQQTVERELYGPAPQLRFASSALIQQAAQVIVQDELSRNPQATVTPQTWERIRSLALQGLANIQAGQPQPMQYAPQPQQQWQPPMQPAAPSGYVFSPQHGGYVPAAPNPMPVYPQPHVPFVAGQHGAPMGVPGGPGNPTPQSEVDSFMRGEWG